MEILQKLNLWGLKNRTFYEYLILFYNIFIKSENAVHRDLKLENVIFLNENTYELKLIDFGFSEKVNKTKLVSRAGTPGFLPPELFKLHPYVEKGDIFSLGVIMYCMVVGSTPFRGETYKNVIENNKNCAVNYDSELIKRLKPSG